MKNIVNYTEAANKFLHKEIVLFKLTSHIIFFYRICNKLYYNNIHQKNILIKRLTTIFIRILSVYYNLLLNVFYGGYIPYVAKIGKNIRFPHGLSGIFISNKAEIGDDCVILHHVTVGSYINKNKGGEFSPKIGEGVFIGCNSCIIGKTIIGNNCQIGAGTTIVNAEIPDNCTVVGSKFRIINQIEALSE